MSDGQVSAMLHKLDVEIQAEDDTHCMILCPFHQNQHSAACSVAKDSGYYLCFNSACGARGPFKELVREVKGWDSFRSLRFMQANKGEPPTYEEIMQEVQASSEEMPEFDTEILNKMQEAFWDNDGPQKYMEHRGFETRTLEQYGVGYDPARQMVVVPMIDNRSRCVGVIGRTCSIGGPKRFKNSLHLPTKKTLFGIDTAKRMGMDNVVICESSFDAMRVWQAGYASVATLGGTFSDYHKTQLARHFDGVILMIDADAPGRKFAARIAKGCKERKLAVYQARYSPLELFPGEAEDASDCTDREISQMVKNKEFFIED